MSLKYLLPASLSLIDATLTLTGQPEAYWKDHSVHNETFPAFAQILAVGPLAFVCAVVVWITLFCVLIRFTPKRTSLVISISFAVGHFIGCLTWILFVFRMPFYLVFLSLPFLAFGIVRMAEIDFANRVPATGSD